MPVRLKNPDNEHIRRLLNFEPGTCSNVTILAAIGGIGSAARDRGTCRNHLTFRRDIVEGTVVDGLRRQLMDPTLFKDFAEEYVGEINRRRRPQNRRHERRTRAPGSPQG